MRQEDKFILELLMPNTDWSSNEKLNNTLDWDYIIHHCTQHKLLPVLYNRIRNAYYSVYLPTPASLQHYP